MTLAIHHALRTSERATAGTPRANARMQWAWEVWQMTLAIHHALRTSERATREGRR